MDVDKWKRCRRWTLVNAWLASFSFGLSITIYYPTEFYYFRDTMTVNNTALYYGLGWASLCGSGVLSSFVGSYYADKTKKVREIFLWTNALNVLGNVFYLLYYSPYLVLFGQFLVGTASARMVTMVGELSRIYESDVITQKISTIVLFSTLGGILAPCSTFLFTMVDTRVGGWVLNVNNMVGVVMGTLYFLLFWFHFFTLRNLSKEYNMKRNGGDNYGGDNHFLGDDKTFITDAEYEAIEENEDIENRIEEITSLPFKHQYMVAIKTVLTNKKILYLYLFTFWSTYARGTIAILLPTKSSLYLGWLQKDLAIWNIILAVGGAIPTAVLIGYISKHVEDLYLLVHSIVTLLFLLLFMGVVPIATGNIVLVKVLFYMMSIIYGTSSAAFHTVSRSMIAKFLPENIQTAGEAIRNSLFELSYLAVGLSVELPDTYMSEFMLVVAVLTAIALAWLLYKADEFKNIEAIEINSQNYQFT